jgi:hypothetical protein
MARGESRSLSATLSCWAQAEVRGAASGSNWLNRTALWELRPLVVAELSLQTAKVSYGQRLTSRRLYSKLVAGRYE